MANFREGARRIKAVGKLTTLVTAIVIICVVAIQLHFPDFLYLLAALLTFAVPAIAGLTL